MNKASAGALALAVTLAPMSAQATNGLQLIGYGTKSQGMGGASLAFPQDAIAAANNPAGIARVGNRADIGLTTIFADTAYSAGPLTFETDPVAFLPEGGVTYRINDRVSLGVSLFALGLGVDYERPVGLATSETRSSLGNVVVAPTFVYDLAPGHSIGAGLRLVYQIIEQEGFQPLLPNDPGSSTAAGAGFSIGYIGDLTPRLTFAASYMSKVEMGGHDDYDPLIAGGDSIDIPEQYGVGLAWRASERITVAFDYLRINWGDVEAFGTSLNAPPADSGFGWKNQDIYRIGLAYKATDALTVRVGYSTSNDLIGSEAAALSYAAPAVITDHLTLGATYAPNPKTELSISAVRSFEETLNGTGPSAGTSSKTALWAVSLSYGFKF